MRYAPLIAHLGWVTTLFAIGALVPAVTAMVHHEFGDLVAFGGTAGAALFTGTALVLASRGAGSALGRGEVLALATVVLPFIALFGAAPLVLTGAAAGFTDAYFEAVSGLTTTGASVLADVEGLGRGVLMWRAWLQWTGGFAFVVFAVALMPMLDAGGMAMFTSALPAGERASPEPRLRRTALTLGWVYLFLTAVCALALGFAGMSGFDAVVHAFATLSTGGFSTRGAGVADFASPAIEAVLIVFMIVGGINLTLFWALLHGRLDALRRDEELRWLIGGAIVAGLALTAMVAALGDGRGGTLREALFAAVAALTTTGFAMGAGTPTAVALLLLALATLGGASGSTAGGVKLMRAGLAFRHGLRELARLSHPHMVSPIHFAGRRVTSEAMQAVWGYFIVFLTAFAVTAAVLAAFGLDAVVAVILALGAIVNAGAGLAAVAGDGAAFATLPAAAKWVLSVAMIAGRLEFVVVVATVSALFWRR